MRIIVVTNNAQVVKAFAPLDRSRECEVVSYPSGEFSQAQKAFLNANDAFLYFDADDIAESTITRRVKALAEKRPYRFGVVDPSGKVADVSQLFHLSAGDYVGKAELVTTGGPTGVDVALNWRVDRIRESDVVFLREDPAHPEIPPTTRVMYLHPVSEREEEAGEM